MGDLVHDVTELLCWLKTITFWIAVAMGDLVHDDTETAR